MGRFRRVSNIAKQAMLKNMLKIVQTANEIGNCINAFIYIYMRYSVSILKFIYYSSLRTEEKRCSKEKID